METSAGGRAVRKLNSFPATPGKTVVLSLDIKLQKMVEELMVNAAARWWPSIRATARCWRW
jgi:cell division protein FtsI/penicillin-binding protein 2